MPGETIAKTIKRSKARVPAYQRIEEDIRERVRDGRLLPGSMLASRHNLAREYGVALSTAQQAIANLVADGVLETFDRRGTFVSQPRTTTTTETGNVASNLPQARILDFRDPMEVSPGESFLTSGVAPSPQTTTATLGIVATARVDSAVNPDVGSLWARLAIRSLEQVFSAAGGNTRFFDRYPAERGPYPRGLNESNAISIPQAIASLRADGCDAIAVVGLCDVTDMSDEVIKSVDIERVPTVYISWHEVQPPLAQVFYDNRFAGYQAAQHLLRQGYRQLIYLAPFSEAWLTERIGGARNAIRHAGLPETALRLYPIRPQSGEYDRGASVDCVHDLARIAFEQGWQALCPGAAGPCGLIAPNDVTAFAVMEAAAAHGQTPGNDFGLVGFDDDPGSYAVGLTTVRPPIEAMGEEAGRILLRSLHGDKRNQLVRLRSHLIPRASTALRLH